MRLLLFLFMANLASVLSVVIQIEKPKDFKRTVATKTNLLVLFTNGKSPEISNVKDVLKSIEGTVAIVDCTNKELKKQVCKKTLTEENSFVLKHYKDGQFNKDYDRQMTKNSLHNFLRDPTGDLPYEEDPDGSDVIHLLDVPQLDKLMRKNTRLFVLFYTNWCGYCKIVKPFYSALAREHGDKYVLAAMDCDKPENGQVRRRFNVTGFPTLHYIENGKVKHTFDGDQTKEALLGFMKDPSAPAIKKKEEEWATDPNSEIVHLTSKNFEILLKEEKSAIVLFHANWCGHCKQLKPKYEAAYVKMKENKIPGMLAAIDSVRESEIAKQFGVQGYPTLKYFENGEYKYDINYRDTEKIVKFMKNPTKPPVEEEKKKQESSWEDEPSDVVFLDNETFKPFMKKKKHVLLFLYAPWCSHCVETKPEFAKAAAVFKDDPKVAFVAIDCMKYMDICKSYDVSSYPSIRYVSYLKAVYDYTNPRKASSFVEFMKNPEASVNIEKARIVPFTSDKIVILNDDTFEMTMKKLPSAMVMFFVEYCDNSKQLKPIYSNCANILHSKKSPHTLVAVNCARALSVCHKYEIKSYPILKYFRKGKFIKDYGMEKNSAHIMAFLNANNKDEL
ncbi:hypothetical protein PVAND_013148 [Polypedilum vanderplanki]|uniref:Thioredoxin domain-containing protein n=1 Tax=Polypedilum vanderplanki TaxID=319348 RepID=A0A9J6CPK0_POLVA|nr:hypothetical protein PVAND_013148 [Polypedilum vanderplanki]